MSRLLRQNGTIHWKPWKPRSWLGPFSDSELPVLTMEWLQLWTFCMDLNVLISCGVVFVLMWETPKLCPLSSVFPHEIPPDLAIAHKWAITHLGFLLSPKQKTPWDSPLPKTWWPATSPLTGWFHYSTTKINEKESWKKKKVMLVISGDLWVRFSIPIPLLF